VAGACAVIKQTFREASPAEVKEILRATARDVTAGQSNPRTGGHPAEVGADLATGSGLINVAGAVSLAHEAHVLYSIRHRPAPAAGLDFDGEQPAVFELD
jgi:hypothetical protein